MGLYEKLVLLASCLVLAACQSDAVKTMTQAAPVHVEKVERGDMIHNIKVVGTVEASSTVAIIPRVDGQIVQIYFTEGEQVREGQPLVQIDTRPYVAALAEKRAQLAKSEAELAKALQDRKRYQVLAQNGFVSREAYEQMSTDASVLKATVEANRAQIRIAELNLSFCDILAPVSGRIGDLRLHKGSMVKGNDSGPITYIDTIRPCRVVFSVPDGYISALQRRMRRNVLFVEAVPQNGLAERGIVTLLDNNVDVKTGSIRLRGEFENKSGTLWPGQFVEVLLPLNQLDDALLVPCKAIQSGRDSRYVYTVDQENRAVLHHVELLVENGSQCAISGDLRVGDSVVTEGQARLANGTPVTIHTGK